MDRSDLLDRIRTLCRADIAVYELAKQTCSKSALPQAGAEAAAIIN
jgi:hypothetical protein